MLVHQLCNIHTAVFGYNTCCFYICLVKFYFSCSYDDSGVYSSLDKIIIFGLKPTGYVQFHLLELLFFFNDMNVLLERRVTELL